MLKKALVGLLIFLLGKTTARYEEARLELVQAEAELKDTRLKIQKEVSDAYIHVHKELENIKLSESLSLASKQKFIQSQKRYEYGLADYVELQQSRQSYIDALGRLMQGNYRFHIALAELDIAAGLI